MPQFDENNYPAKAQIPDSVWAQISEACDRIGNTGEGAHELVYALDRLSAAVMGEPAIPMLDSAVVNDASWAFVNAMPHDIPAPIWNNLKPALYAAFTSYHRAVIELPKAPGTLAPSIYEDNARVLQSILNEMREMLWAPAGASVVHVLRNHLRTATAMHDALEYLSNIHPRRCHLQEVVRARDAIERYRALFQPEFREPT